MFKNDLTRRLNMEYPIIQAPMAGGLTTTKLIAEVSNAGGLGSLGAAYLTPEVLCSTIQEIRQLTDQPFGVNLFVPGEARESQANIEKMTTYLNKYRIALGIKENPPIDNVSESFEEQVQVLLEEKVPVFSFTFGIPSTDVIQTMKKQGIAVIGTATTVEEAKQLELAGVDAIVAQGSEAGGHRGAFLSSTTDSLVGTMALVPQIVDQVAVPVIASGGIMDGRGLVASLTLGASAVQMGTAFIASVESGAHNVYKKAILSANEDATVVTRAYSGKPARGIQTAFIHEIDQYSGAIPSFPIQNAMTKDIRQAAAKNNNQEYMSLWAGQGLRLATDHSAATIIKQTMNQSQVLLEKMIKGRD